MDTIDNGAVCTHTRVQIETTKGSTTVTGARLEHARAIARPVARIFGSQDTP